jgi:hypothetical protein
MKNAKKITHKYLECHVSSLIDKLKETARIFGGRRL